MTSDLRPPTSVLHGLRVCFIAGQLGQGGAERQLFYIASALRSCGAQVMVLALISGEIWESRLKAIGIPVEFVGASASRLRRLIHVIKRVRDFRPDVVQSQHFYTNAYSAVAARLTRTRAVGAVRSCGSPEGQNCGPRLATACLHLPHLLGVNSHAAIRVLISLGCREQKLHYLPNVIDLRQFRPNETGNSHPLTILGIGRLGPEKRFDRFLRTLVLLRRLSDAPFRALIAGDGPLRSELERLARDSGLSPGTIEICGNVPDIQSLYAKAHLLLLTSDHEGSPNVVMEAMASGLPVVATAVGGVPELVQNGMTGFLADPGDEQGLAEAVSSLLKDDALWLAMSHRARAFVEARHSLLSLPAQLEGLYRRVLRIERRVTPLTEAKAV